MKRGLSVLFSIMIVVLMLLSSISMTNADDGVAPTAAIFVSNIADLQDMINDLAGSYNLTGNINASITQTWNGGLGFIPVGNTSDPFTGTFNGNGYVISGLFINRSTEDNIGLFGNTQSTVMISNVTINEHHISGKNNVAALVGLNRGIIFNVSTIGFTHGVNQVGGLVGRNNGGGILDCYSHGTVNGTSVRAGGLVGLNKNAAISRCWSTADVYGYSRVGGLVGLNDNGNISNSYSSGMAAAYQRFAGGLVANNTGDIYNSYSMGTIVSPVKVGGLVADNTGSVIGSYWDNQTSGLQNSDGGEGRYSNQMKREATFIGWDFINIWSINENIIRPYFQVNGYFNRTLMDMTVILGSPTNTSILVSVCAFKDLETYVEYGTISDIYSASTPRYIIESGRAVEILVKDLDPDTEYIYRVRYRDNGTLDPFETRKEHGFHTHRPAGSNFTFTITSDSHRGKTDADTLRYNNTLYERTLRLVNNDEADFHLDLGDTFLTDRQKNDSYDYLKSRYIKHRNAFELFAEGSPLYHASGNWDGEMGWYLNGTANNLAVNASKARTHYYPFPVPDQDGFYTGDDVDHNFTGLLEEYYAWEWGDALFVVLQPYWNTLTEPSNPSESWYWTLGYEQYKWLGDTLQNSSAKFKFVFSHHVSGSSRGGIEEAKFYEWGGYESNGTWGFDINRPGWGKPIHQMFVDYNVSIYFQGHDHVFAQQVLDGVVYQTVPQPSNLTYGDGFASDYNSGLIINNSGYLRVNVSGDDIKVEYVRTFLAEDVNATQTNGMVAATYYYPLPDDFEAPDIQHTPQVSVNVTQNINISAIITDNVDVISAFLDYTDVHGVRSNISMSRSGTNWYHMIPGQDIPGIVEYFIWADDTSGNGNMTAVFQVQVNDISDPVINHIPVTSDEIGQFIQITVNVTDNVAVDSVYLDYTNITGDNFNLSMTKTGDNWYFEIPGQNATGNITYFIWADDTSGNWVMTPVYQISIINSTIPPIVYDDLEAPMIIHTPLTTAFVEEDIDIIATVLDNVSVESVFLNYTDVGMVDHHIDMPNSLDVWSYSIPGQMLDGQIIYHISAIDTSGNINRTLDYTINIIDNIKPIIAHTPTTLAYVSNGIDINAVVTDNIGLDDVKLDFTDIDGMSYNVSMSLHNGTWMASIPPQSNAGTVTYRIWAEDVNQNYAITSEFTIFIQDVSDATSPTVVSYSPTGESVSIDSTISIVFSETMDKTSVENAISINPSMNIAYMNWTGDTELEIVLEGGLTFNTTYNVTIGANAKDIGGNELANPISWEFTTELREAEVDIDDPTNWLPLMMLMIIVIMAIVIIILIAKNRSKDGEDNADGDDASDKDDDGKEESTEEMEEENHDDENEGSQS